VINWFIFPIRDKNEFTRPEIQVLFKVSLGGGPGTRDTEMDIRGFYSTLCLWKLIGETARRRIFKFYVLEMGNCGWSLWELEHHHHHQRHSAHSEHARSRWIAFLVRGDVTVKDFTPLIPYTFKGKGHGRGWEVDGMRKSEKVLSLCVIKTCARS